MLKKKSVKWTQHCIECQRKYNGTCIIQCRKANYDKKGNPITRYVKGG